MKKSLILIVEDVAENIQLLETILKNKGYATVPATNGKTALKLLQTIHPDLILLDIMMPGIDGYEVCEIIKSDKKLSEIPIIFLTGKSDIDNVIHGLKLGASDYISKPFNITELLLRVETQVQLKKSQDQLRKNNITLQQLNASKDKFFSIISHDMKSPFQGLIGLTELLNEDIVTMEREEIREFAVMIHESARNLLNLLENLLEWSVLERNNKKYEPENTDINEIIRKNVQLFSASSNKKQLTVHNSADEPAIAWVDRKMIDTVVRNLLSNAIKYTPAGGEIKLFATKHNSKVLLKITDSGIGMDETTQNKLFRIGEIKSKPGTNNEKGTGLGLLICKDLVDINKGSIHIVSSPDQGSTFTLTLPSKKKEKANQLITDHA